MKHKLLILFLFFSLFCYSQENCNNGIDDDGDGKIDSNDEDCICSNSTITSIIPNPSFEEYVNCPTQYSELNMASPWIQATNATTDYFNKCGLIAPGIKTAGLNNFPDGNGIIGAIFKDNFQEYVGSKLLSSMKAGVQYQLTLNIAALSLNGNFQLTNDKYEPVNLTLFGCADGDNLPLLTNGGPTSYDPTWIELGHTNYALSPNWGEITISFTPITDINAIILGAPNKLPASYPESVNALFPYFLYDNLLLNTSASFGININQTGNFCDNTLVLKASLTTTVNSNKKYQWYHNGIAILGATNDSYNVPSIEANLGQYSVKLTEENNCLISRNITINNVIPSPNFTVVAPNCITTTGTINITTPASEYSFDNGLTWQTSSSKNSLQAGSYGVKIKTSNGCVSLWSAVNILPPKMLDFPEQIVTQPLTCDGKGSITIKSSIAIQYSFDDGITWTTNPTKNNLDPGNYLIKIKDASECQSSGQYASIYRKYLENPVFSIVQPSCGKAGQITVTTLANQYSFDNGVTWTTNPIFSNLEGGNYRIKIKNDNGCESNTVYANIESYRIPIYPTYTRLQPICGTGGTITITSEASEFSFNGGKTWTKDPIATNLLPGIYEIILKNELGCISFSTYVNLDYFYLPNPSFTFTKPTCEIGGTITITTPASEYSFDNGKTWSTNRIASNLKAGTYYIMIKNEIGCTSSTYHYVNLDNFYLPDPEFIAVNPSCGNIGSIEIISKADFYSFNGGVSWTTSPIKSNLSAGSYFLKVKNNLGCISNNIIVYLDSNYLASPNCEVTQPTCNKNGAITIKTKADFYSFDNGATWTTNPTAVNLPPNNYYYIKIKNTSECVSNSLTILMKPFYLGTPVYDVTFPSCDNSGNISIQTKADFYSFDNGITWTSSSSLTNLTPNRFYYILIKNNLGCTSLSQSVYVPSFYLDNPTYTLINPTCGTKGSITINTKSEYYSFDNGNTWTTNPVLSNLSQSNYYYIKIKNNKGCESNYIFVYMESAPKISPKPTITSISPTNCGTKDGSIIVKTSAAYYSFDNGITWGKTSRLESLEVGTYQIKIKESLSSCPSEAETVTLNSNNILPSPTFSVVQPTCILKTGSISITTVGSQYSFDNGITWQTQNFKTNILPGEYPIKIKNEQGCISNSSIVKIITYLSYKIQSYSSEQPLCIGNSPTGIVIKIDTPSSEYSFDDGFTWSTNPIATNLKENTEYCLRIKNADGCVSEPSCMTTIKQVAIPAAPQITTNQPSGCNSNGSITVNTIKREYSFDDGKTWDKNQTSIPLAPGTYFVRTKEIGSECISEASKAIINNPPNAPKTPETIIFQPITCATPFGSIQITSLETEYSFDNGNHWTSNPISEKLVAGTYYIKSKNNVGCESNAVKVIITAPTDYPNAPTITILQPNCSNLKGQINITSLASEYSFDDGLTWTTSQISDYLNAGDYNVKIKNSDGCTSEPTKAIIAPFTNFPLSPTGSQIQSFCIDEIATLENLNLTGSNIKWYDAATNGIILSETTLLQNGTYYASQTINNCESPRIAVTVKIQDTKPPIANSPQAFCIQKNALIHDIDIAGQNIKWYESASSNITSSELTPLENGATYYASQTTNSCESDRIPVTVNILEATFGDCINYVDELPFPKFFTPNNDGFNDSWTINFAYLAPNTGIRIFDRYGKFIKELPINASWDGTYIGQDEPASDYWFTVTRLNGTEYRSHFSLKR